MPRRELYPFRFRDPLTGKWIRARYKASLADLEQRHGEGRYEITGPPEIRNVDANARYFNPLRDERQTDKTSIGNVGPIMVVSRPLGLRPRPVTVAGIAI